MSKRIVPECETLAKWQSEGLTRQQMVDRIWMTQGERVTATAVTLAMQRCGLAEKAGSRYKDYIPWRVRPEHAMEYPARMLRLLGRSHRGETLNTDEQRRLTSWLATLETQHAVVAYSPQQGFLYTDRIPEDSTVIPIRSGYVQRA